MNADRLAILENVVGRWSVDLDLGTVTGRRGVQGHLTPKGYLMITTSYKEGKVHKKCWFFVHEIIAYCGGLDILNLTINHKNGNKLDNRLSNLEAITNSANMRHANEIGLRKNAYHCGTNHHRSFLDEDQIHDIKTLMLVTNLTNRQIAGYFGVKKGYIGDVSRGRTWGFLKVVEPSLDKLKTLSISPEEKNNLLNINKRNRFLSPKQVQEIRQLSSIGYTQQHLAELFGLSTATIFSIIHHNIYKDIPSKENEE